MRKNRFGKSGWVAVLVVALLLGVTSNAMAGSGRGGAFNLGVLNTINGYITSLRGTNGGPLLGVTNTATGSSAGAISGTNDSGAAAAVRARNLGGGPALEAIVPAGRSPLRISAGAAKVGNLNADKLDGFDASQFQRRVSGTCAAGSTVSAIGAGGTVTCQDTVANAHQAANADQLDGMDAGDFQRSYTRTIVVSPVGTALENGTALRTAHSDITAAADAPVLLKIEPGTYDLGGAFLAMKEYVDIEGAGQSATVITCECGGTSFAPTTASHHTLRGASNAELRFLRVENTGNDLSSIGILSLGGASPRLTFVAAYATGAVSDNPSMSPSNMAIYNSGGATALTNVTAIAAGAGSATGIYNADNAATVMRDVTATATVPPVEGGAPSGSSSGVFNNNASAQVTLQGVLAKAQGAAFASGIRNFRSSAVIQNTIATASGAVSNAALWNDRSSPSVSAARFVATTGTDSYGVRNDYSSPTLSAVEAAASSATVNNYGVYNWAQHSLNNPESTLPVLQGVIATGKGGTNGYGVYSATAPSSSSTASPQIVGGVFEASGASEKNDAVSNTGPGTTQISGAWLKGSARSVGANSATSVTKIHAATMSGAVDNQGTMSLDSVRLDGALTNYLTLRVGGSMVGGTITDNNGGISTCVASYNAAYVALPDGDCTP